MGIYDRDYERERDVYDDSPGFHLGNQLTLTTKLVIFMGAVYVVQLLARRRTWFTDLFSSARRSCSQTLAARLNW